MSAMPFRTIGSPPVSRIFLTPISTNVLATWTTSLSLIILLSGESGTPSSGMQ